MPIKFNFYGKHKDEGSGCNVCSGCLLSYVPWTRLMGKLDLGLVQTWELRSAQSGFSKALGFRCLVKALAIPAEIC